MKVDYTIDLSLPPVRRWEVVAKKEKPRLKKIVNVIKGFVLSVPKPVFRAIAAFYWLRNATYLREANAFADVLGEKRELIQAAQLMYELVHLVDKNSFKRAIPAVGCTTMAYRAASGNVEMLRTLDWDLAGMKDATRTYQFKGPAGDYVGVGTVGAVSVFTAMHLESGVVVALNDAPPVHRLRGGRAPSFEIRRAMETSAEFEDQLAYLRRPRLATSAFFTMASPTTAVRLEHTGKHAVVAQAVAGVICTTNHYQTLARDVTSDADEDSVTRASLALRAAAHRNPVAAFLRDPISRDITQYRVRCVPQQRLLELF